MKNKIILVAGYPAAGKSTFSQNLSQYLGIPCFNKDIIKEVMSDGFGIENSSLLNQDKKGSAVTFMLILHIAEHFLQTGNICILESNFRMWELDQIRILLGKYNGESLLFVFKGDLDVLFDRYVERSSERHWVHKSAGDRDTFKKVMKEAFGLAETASEQSVVIDATSFSDINYSALFDSAKRFLEIEI